MRYPIVKLLDKTARAKLVADLKALGFRRREDMDPVPPLTYPHIAVCSDSYNEITGQGEGWSSVRYTLVNSPAHLIAYLKTHAIKPFSAAPKP